MKCNVCGKPILKHTRVQTIKCLGDAGFSTEGVAVFDLIRETGTRATINYKHNYIKYNDGEITNSEDMDTDLLRICLTGKNVKPKKKETSKKEEDEDKNELSGKEKLEMEE